MRRILFHLLLVEHKMLQLLVAPGQAKGRISASASNSTPKEVRMGSL